MIERIADRHQPAVDRGGACDRHLLRHDDLRQTGEAAVAAAQRRPSGALRDRSPARIGGEKRRDAVIEIGLGVNVGRHALGVIAGLDPAIHRLWC